MRLLRVCLVLAVLGLILTAIIAEWCRYGYVPTREQEEDGMINPYTDDERGCRGKRADKLWGFQVLVVVQVVVEVVV
jgi:hypothetical protein